MLENKIHPSNLQLGAHQLPVLPESCTSGALGSLILCGSSFLEPQSSAGFSSQTLKLPLSGSCSEGRMEDGTSGMRLCPCSAGSAPLKYPALSKTLVPRSLSASDSWGFGFPYLKMSRRATKILGMKALDCFDPETITDLSSTFLFCMTTYVLYC